MQRVGGFWERELLPGESGDEASAARDAASFKAPQPVEDFTPVRTDRLAHDEVPEDDSPALEELGRDRVPQLVGIELGRVGAFEQRPSPSRERRWDASALG